MPSVCTHSLALLRNEVCVKGGNGVIMKVQLCILVVCCVGGLQHQEGVLGRELRARGGGRVETQD